MDAKPFQLTAVIEREDDWFVATGTEVDVARQGESITIPVLGYYELENRNAARDYQTIGITSYFVRGEVIDGVLLVRIPSAPTSFAAKAAKSAKLFLAS